jgi:hypothetical protein
LGWKTRSFNDSIIQEDFMRNHALLAALAGAIVATAVGSPNRADAMTLTAPAGVLRAVEAVAQPEQVRWCGGRGCWHGGGGAPYWPGPPYGLYQSYPYVGYNLVPGGYYYRPLVWPHAWGYRPW